MSNSALEMAALVNGEGVKPVRDESSRGVGMSDSFDGRGDS